MLKRARHWLRSNPHLYDLSVQTRRVLGIRTTVYTLLNEFSLIHGRPVRFIQIGASDGLRSDPIREFVVRDRWAGVFVEPLPDSFTRLERNYRYLGRPDLAFVNAAIVAAGASTTSFWTFSETFLTGLPDEDRLNVVQKSSFNHAHVSGCFGSTPEAEQMVVEIPVPCLTLSDLVDQHLNFSAIDLLVTDLEGYEATLIPSIDFRMFSPTAIFYESHNLGENEATVSHFLAKNGYHVFCLGGDSFAVKAEFLTTWQGKSAWALRNLACPATRAKEAVIPSQISQETHS